MKALRKTAHDLAEWCAFLSADEAGEILGYNSMSEVQTTGGSVLHLCTAIVLFHA